jgi:capsular exopolysaccharide synthesis family protein
LQRYEIESPEATEFRRLFSRLRRTGEPEPVKSILVTSAVRGEGKSTTASYLAITAARYRKTKTLLVDGDLRKPKIHSLFQLRNQPGLSEVLSGASSLKACFKSTSLEGLKILTAGKARLSPSESFDSDRMKDVFEEMRFYFDVIIVDAAPVIAVSDPIILGSEVGGVLLVVMAGKTPREVVKRAKNILADSNVHILGVVLNNADEVLPYYYDYRYYGYPGTDEK